MIEACQGKGFSFFLGGIWNLRTGRDTRTAETPAVSDRGEERENHWQKGKKAVRDMRIF